MKKPPRQKKNLQPIADFLFEMGILAKTPRSGFSFLGTGKQSIAEHINRVMYAGYALAHMEGDVDVSKVMALCLFHDTGEARAIDLGYVHQKYTVADEHKAVADMTADLPFGETIRGLFEEYEAKASKEAIVAKDADNIELLLKLKELADTGNKKALTWMPSLLKRLKTKSGQQLAKQIMKTSYDHWWFQDPNSQWWVNRNGKK